MIAYVAVRAFPTGRQQYGYLRFEVDRRTATRYVGKVTSASRLASFERGWRLLRQRKVAKVCGWARVAQSKE